MMKKINTLLVLIGWIACMNELHGQQTILRKDLRKQEARTAIYSKKKPIFTNQLQIGTLLRTASNDSLNSLSGMRAWQYGAGIGWIFPVAGPLWLRTEANYRFRNYRMQKEDFAILAQVDQLHRYRLASHAFEIGLNIRLANSRGGLEQGKYVEIGYLYGYNFANRIVYTQAVDPATSMGASTNKTKLMNPDFFARTTHYAQVVFGRETLSLFAQYRISDWFVRSKNVYNNQSLPELSPLTLGITLLLTNDPQRNNTDENDAPSD